MQPVFLQVTPVVNGSKIDLRMCSGTLCGTTPGTYPTVSLDTNSGAHVFIVSITDPTQGVSFADDAVWIHKGKGSPSGQGLGNNGQIASFTKANNSTIFFTDNNDNATPMTLGYSLHFKGPNNTDLVIDPDIKNGGGTSVYSNTLVIASVALGAATLAAILFVAIQQSALKRMIAALVGGARAK